MRVIDISEMDLPLCDGDKCYGMSGSKRLSAAIEAADGILVAAPTGTRSEQFRLGMVSGPPRDNPVYPSLTERLMMGHANAMGREIWP